ncbi:MAG: hypothetical protein HY537_08075 [Deltaproteobacteria bacterium]|nr:hypothetical protein [Deltaproteobacteria bacterium]
MEEVLRYLELKNQYYAKFYSLTSRFLDQANSGRWEDLELFVDNRERILGIIRGYDAKLSLVFQKLELSNQEICFHRERVQSLIRERNSLGQKIVAQDLEMISKLDDLKSDTIKELKRSMETSQQLNSFSAGQPPKHSLKARRFA